MSLDDKLEVLEQKMAVVNNLAAMARTSITNLDAAFQEMNVGLTVWADSAVSYEDKQFQIGYSKAHSRWCLVFREVDTDNGIMPLSQAPRLLRIRACSLLEGLVVSVIARVDQYLPQPQEISDKDHELKKRARKAWRDLESKSRRKKKSS